jgi:ATP-dependent RNA helicase RhlE
VIFGGVKQGPQTRALHRGVDILVATPGRLLDLLNQRLLSLSSVEIFVLDEADHMLDMGFIRDIRTIIAKLPAKRQTLLFSATMPADIAALADQMLKSPATVAVTPVATTVEKVEQRVIYAEKAAKPSLLSQVLKTDAVECALVFTRTKHGADKVVRALDRFGVFAEAIHGNKAQGARQRALTNFKTGRTRVLVATDIASRGIDVQEISHVFNYDLPEVAESYVHRIGRTGRNGASGFAVAFCDGEERAYLRQIERLTRQQLPVLNVPEMAAPPPLSPEAARAEAERSARPERGSRGARPEGGRSSYASRPTQGTGNRSSGRPPERRSDAPARSDTPRTYGNAAATRHHGSTGDSRGPRREGDGHAPRHEGRKEYTPFWKRNSASSADRRRPSQQESRRD